MRFYHVLWFFVLSLGACQNEFDDQTKQSEFHPQVPWQEEAKEIKQLIDDGDLEEASSRVKIALQNFPEQPSLHVLNGLVYHKSSESSQGDNPGLAEVAYQTALNLDPQNWTANFLMGRLKAIDTKDYREAQKYLAKALVIKPDHPESLYYLALASYYLGDIETANMAITKALDTQGGKTNPLFLRTATLIAAAQNNVQGAIDNFTLFRQIYKGNPEDVEFVRKRILDWQNFYNKGGSTPIHKTAKSLSKRPEGANNQTDREATDSVVYLDCFLLSSYDTAGSSKGSNILSNIKMTFDPRSFHASTDKVTTNGILTTTIKKEFSRGFIWDAIQYSADILNVSDERVEILGRPTLATFFGKQADFFSGTRLTSGLKGSTGGSLLTEDIGTTVNVKPEKVSDDEVILHINIESADIADEFNSSEPVDSQILQIRKTNTSSTLQLKYGEIGILSAHYQRESRQKTDGVPFLRDLPIVQYFFSQQTNQGRKNAILFLVTPRKQKPDIGETVKVISLSKNQDTLAALKAWRKSSGVQPQIKSGLILAIKDLAPQTLQEMQRRGDVLPLHHGGESLLEEVAPLSSFLYY